MSGPPMMTKANIARRTERYTVTTIATSSTDSGSPTRVRGIREVELEVTAELQDGSEITVTVSYEHADLNQAVLEARVAAETVLFERLGAE